MSTFRSDDTRVKYTMPFGTNSSEDRNPDLRKVGKDIYELLTNTGSHGYKQRMRKRTIKIETEKNYEPAEVAAFLNVSYDAALRLMQKMKGVIDLGTPTRRYKRGKKKLRISGTNLLKFLRAKTKD
jgi:hypothetical protein